jgi:hypothetical protein
MPAMLHRPLAVLCVASTLVFLLTAALSVWSYFASPQISYMAPRVSWYLLVEDGLVQFVRNDYRRPVPLRGGELMWSLTDPPLSSAELNKTLKPWETNEHAWHHAGVLYLKLTPGRYDDGPTQRVLVFPVWPLTVLASVPPLLWLLVRSRRSARARRWQRRGCCPGCAYALAGIAAETCPECGAKAASGANARPATPAP